jgi:hypothetical protein
MASQRVSANWRITSIFHYNPLNEYELPVKAFNYNIASGHHFVFKEEI